MKKELDLAKKPQRPTFQKEVEATKERAYERAFKQTSKEVAAAEGAAAGVAAAASTADPIVEAARQRALQGSQPTAPARSAGAASTAAPSTAAAKPSGRFIDTPEGRVPEEFYSLSPEQQKQFRALAKEAEGESRFDRVALAVLDQQEAQAKRITGLERLVQSLVGENMELRRRQDGVDARIEVAKSDELAEQQVALAQMTTNLSAIRAEAGAEMAEYQRQREVIAIEHAERMAIAEQGIGALEGRVSSTTTLMQERSNAAIDAVADVEPKVQQLDVQLTELANRTDALGSPITRAEMKADITTAVTEELKASSPRLVDEAIAVIKQDEFGGGTIYGQRRDGDYIRQKRADADAAANIR